MIFLPCFLYILSNSPVYIPKRRFQEINYILTSFIWGGRAVRIAKDTLLLPILERGLALPTEFAPSSIHMGQRQHKYFIHDTADIPTVKSGVNTVFFPNAPIWNNQCLQEFFQRTDRAKLISHLFFFLNTFCFFAEFCRDFNLPPTAYFRYLQLRHNAAAQIGLRNVSIQTSPLERQLTDPSHSKLISTYYASLLHSTTDGLNSTEVKWCSDIPELTEEIWQEILPLQVPGVISFRDKVIQTKFFIQIILYSMSPFPS